MTFTILKQHTLSTLILLSDERLHLVVDKLCSLFAIGFVELLLRVVVAQIRQAVAHTGISNHAIGLLGDTLKVVHRTGRDAPDKEFLCGTTAQDSTHLIEHLLLGCNLTLFRQIPCSTEGTTTRHNGYLHQRIGILQMPRERSMTSLVKRNCTLLFHGKHLGLLLQATNNTVYCCQEILFVHRILSMTSCDECSFVANIGNISTRETWSLTSQEVDIKRLVELQRTQMHAKNLFALIKIGKVDMNLTIETTRTQQCLVKNVNTVGSRKNDNATICSKAIHLSQQLVERILTFIVTTHCGILSTSTSHSINLIDKDDTWSLLLGLTEKIAHTRSTNADKHLHKI